MRFFLLFPSCCCTAYLGVAFYLCGGCGVVLLHLVRCGGLVEVFYCSFFSYFGLCCWCGQVGGPLSLICVILG